MLFQFQLGNEYWNCITPLIPVLKKRHATIVQTDPCIHLNRKLWNKTEKRHIFYPVENKSSRYTVHNDIVLCDEMPFCFCFMTFNNPQPCVTLRNDWTNTLVKSDHLLALHISLLPSRLCKLQKNNKKKKKKSIKWLKNNRIKKMYVYSLLVHSECSLVIGCGSEWHIPVDSDSADLSRTSSFFVHLLIIVKVIIVVLMIYSNW